jgi:hypothetical protein
MLSRIITKIAGHVFEALHQTARPANLDGIGLGGFEIGGGYAMAVEGSGDARAGIENRLRLQPFALATSKIPKQ